MLEVCEDQQCQPDVFFLAVNYLDRFLSKVNIYKNQVKLCAAVCILLASKMSEVSPIIISQLVHYSDHSITLRELLEWEVMVLTAINWELSTITPMTVYKQLSHRLSLNQDKIVSTLLLHCSSNHHYSSLLPSITAAAAVTAAQQLANSCQDETLSEDLVKKISNILQVLLQKWLN